MPLLIKGAGKLVMIPSGPRDACSILSNISSMASTRAWGSLSRKSKKEGIDKEPGPVTFTDVISAFGERCIAFARSGTLKVASIFGAVNGGGKNSESISATMLAVTIPSNTSSRLSWREVIALTSVIKCFWDLPPARPAKKDIGLEELSPTLTSPFTYPFRGPIVQLKSKLP